MHLPRTAGLSEQVLSTRRVVPLANREGPKRASALVLELTDMKTRELVVPEMHPPCLLQQLAGRAACALTGSGMTGVRFSGGWRP